MFLFKKPGSINIRDSCKLKDVLRTTCALFCLKQAKLACNYHSVIMLRDRDNSFIRCNQKLMFKDIGNKVTVYFNQ